MTDTELFPLGRTALTEAAVEAFSRPANNDGRGPLPYIARHAAGDCGEIAADDQAFNDWAVVFSDERLVSAYRLPDGTPIWIVTEADRSATTVLVPGEE
jgi:hypothetical protein